MRAAGKQIPGPLFTGKEIEGTLWYDNAPTFDGNPTDTWKQVDWKKLAKELLEEVTIKYEKKTRSQKSGLPKDFLESTKRSGTLRDQVGALITVVEEAPLYKLKELTSLIDQLEKKSKRLRLLIFPALKDLFINTLLPDRYLVHFSQRNFDIDTLTKRHLIYAIYESHLKELYQRYLLCLEELSQDPLEYPRNVALKIAKELVERKPEGERFLLALIINKMGDPCKMIASKSGYFLHKILFQHPHMKECISKEVMQFCLRPNLPLHAKQYALNFLSLLRFNNKEDPSFLQRLLAFYLSQFHHFISERNKHHKEASEDNYSKSISYLLQGIKRCILFLKEQELSDQLERELSSIFQVAKSSESDRDWIAALELLYHVRMVDLKGSEGFGKVLYQRTFDALNLNVQKQERFLRIVSDSLQNDNKIDRVCALTKRIFQAALESNASFAAACLLAICLDTTQSELKGTLSSFIRFPEQGTEEDSNTKAESLEYNGYVMNPLKANASVSCLWELELLSHHFHPSVALFASNLLDICETPTYSGRPLVDFSLASFLERFSQRKPKAGVVQNLRGVSVIDSPKVFNTNDVESVEDHLNLDLLVSELGYGKLKKTRKRKARDHQDENESEEELDEEFERHIRHKFGNSLEIDDDWDGLADVGTVESEDDEALIEEEPLDDFNGVQGKKKTNYRNQSREKKKRSVFVPAEEYEG